MILDTITSTERNTMHQGGFTLQNQELQAMTVVQLRKLARENGVKLSAGIDKEGIVERLAAKLEGAQSATQSMPEESGFAQEARRKSASVLDLDTDEREAAPENPMHGYSVAADVTSVAPGGSYRSWNSNRASAPAPVETGAPTQPVYRQAWQARSTTPPPRQPVRQSAWQQPQRPAAPVSRFGPQTQYAPQPQPAAEPQREDRYADPQPDNTPRLDGYRLGYRAAPQRPQAPRQEYARQESYRAPYRQENSYQPPSYQQRQPMGQPSYSQPSYQPQTFQQPAYSPQQEEHFNDSLYKPVRDPAFAEPYDPSQPVPDLLQVAQGEPVKGVLEILPDGYGFLRGETLLPGKKDIYVSVAQIRRFSLRTGDRVEGKARTQRDGDKFAALLLVEKLNGQDPKENPERLSFENLVPVYPNRRIVLESEENSAGMPIRMVDLIAPIGFGQRAMIIAPPDSGRMILLRDMSRAIKRNDPNAHVMLLLIDVAPEEVTEIRESVDVEVFASTFAESPESQTRVSETMLERAQRMVEDGQNVVILLDSLTKLTRAYQATLTQGGRAMTNTVTPAALVRPKRFFGAARNTRDGGSLTMIATIAVETGSRVDDIIYEEFKGTANMEVRLCAPGLNDPVFPLIDLQMSGTKKEDILLNDEEKESLRSVRTVLGSTTNREAVVQLIDMMNKTKCNADLFSKLKDWVAMWAKSGFLVKK